MSEIVGLKVELDVSGAVAPMQGLRGQIKDATNELTSMADKFGASSREAQNAAKKVAELKDKLGDARQLVDAFNPDAKFNALTQALGGAVGGFQAFTGAMGLLGFEGKNLEAQLVKIQSVMALSGGLSAFLDGGIEGFRNLGRVVSGTVSTAFGTLKNAIISTGIGALIVLLGVAIANFDELSVAIGLTTRENQSLNAINEEVNQGMVAIHKSVNEVAQSFTQAKAGVISKEDALKKYNSTLGSSLGYASSFNHAEKLFHANTPNYLKAMQARITAQAAMAKIAELQVKLSTVNNKEDLSTVDKVLDATVGNVLRVIGAGSEANQWIDTQLIKQKNVLTQSIGEYQKIVEQQEAIASNADKISGNRTDASTAFKSTIKSIPTSKPTSKPTSTKSGKAIGTTKQSESDKYKAVDVLDSKSELEEYLQVKQAKLDAEEKANEKIAESKKYLYQRATTLELDHTAVLTTQEQQRKLIRDQEHQHAMEMVGAYADLLENLSTLVGNNTQAGKAFAIAATTIKTYEAAQDAYSAASKNPATIAFPAYPYIVAGSAIVAGLARVKAIASVNTKTGAGSGGAGGSAPNAPSQTIYNTTTKLNKDSIDKINDKSLKAYVVETDLANSQKRIERILINTKFK